MSPRPLRLLRVALLAAAAAVLGVVAVAAVASAATVTASNFQWTPSSVTIGVGESVTFENGGGSHNLQMPPDGATCALPCTKTFATAGTFSYDCGLHPSMVGTVTVQATEPEPPANRAPVAAFTATPTDLTVSVDASGSSDPDGDPLTFTWAWGDGASATGVTATHAYASGGTFTVTLTVSDGALSSTATRAVTVSGANRAPTAAMAVTQSGLTVSVDAGASTDPDGDALSFTWNWGDDTPAATGRTATHTYATAGEYTLTLAASDGQLVAHATRVIAAAPANAAPVALFDVTVDGFRVAADASASSDADGDALSFTWAWGDGDVVAGGPLADHAYATAGAFVVRLTVTDGHDNASFERQVTIEPPNVPPTLTLVAGAGNGTAVRGEVSWTLEASDPDGDAFAVAARASAGDDMVTTGNGPFVVLWNASSAPAGLVDVTFTAMDARGGRFVLPLRMPVAAPPVVTLDAVPAALAPGTAFTLSGRVMGGAGGVAVHVTLGSGEAAVAHAVAPTAEGAWTLALTVPADAAAGALAVRALATDEAGAGESAAAEIAVTPNAAGDAAAGNGAGTGAGAGAGTGTGAGTGAGTDGAADAALDANASGSGPVDTPPASLAAAVAAVAALALLTTPRSRLRGRQ